MKPFKGWMIDDVRFMKGFPTRTLYLEKKFVKQFVALIGPKENPFRIVKVEVREKKG